MNGKINGIVKAAASISLAGGILAAAAGPAAAASPNSSDGVQATGLVGVLTAVYEPCRRAQHTHDMRKLNDFRPCAHRYGYTGVIGIFRQFNSLNWRPLEMHSAECSR
jgi:hypothetical protein